MPSESKISQLILRLTKATINGEIEWKLTMPPTALTFATDEVIPFYLEASYKDKMIALFERRYRTYDGEHDIFYWVGDDVFALFSSDLQRKLIWEYRENSSTLANLIRVAREAASGIDDILDDLLT